MCGMAAIAFRRDGLALAAFSHQQLRLRVDALQRMGGTHVPRLRPPLRLLPSPRWNFNQVRTRLC
jgi:hypothetical protein